jgi:DNA topoisomerase-1
MAKPVVVVESVEKARTLEEQLGGEVETLLVRSLPVKVSPLSSGDRMRKEASRFSFTACAEGKEFFDRLLACQGRQLYLAFADDWQGEFWAWAISGYWATLGAGAVQPGRLYLAGLSGSALHESFRLIAPVHPERGIAGYIRMLFDAGLGRHLQRLLGTRSGPGGLPINHMSLATLFLLAEREKEVHSYTPPPWWRLRIRLASDAGAWDVWLQEAYGITDDGFLRNEKEVREAVALFDKKMFAVVKVEETRFSLSPPGPYHCTTLLHDCVVRCGLKPFAAWTALRNLYHGIVVDGKRQGFATSFLPQGNTALEGVLADVRRQVEVRMGAAALGPEDRPESDGGLILPTRPEIEPGVLQGKLPEEEWQVYHLLWSRAMASQMHQATGKDLTVVLKAGDGCLFAGKVRNVTEEGFLALQDQGHDGNIGAVFPFAAVREGRQLQCLQILPEKNTGTPPEYYTVESLTGDLADFALEMDGVGVALLQQMLDQGYLNVMPDGSFRCAENMARLISVMDRAFPSMKGINFSAYLAQTIEEVVSGRKPLDFALQQFEQTMIMRGDILVKAAAPVMARRRGITSRSIIRGSEEAGAGRSGFSPAPGDPGPLPQQEVRGAETDDELPGSVMAEVVPAGQELASPSGLQEECVEEEAVAAGEGAVTCGETEVVAAMENFVSEAATEEIFAGVSSRETGQEEVIPAADVDPLARETETAGDDGEAEACSDCGPPPGEGGSFRQAPAPVLPCPLCRAGRVVNKRTPTGKIFYVCSEQECEFMAWARPHAVPCPLCGFSFLEEGDSRGGKAILRCPRSGCSYQRPLPGSAGGPCGEAGQGPRPVRKVVVRRVAGGTGSGGTRKVRVVRKKQ